MGLIPVLLLLSNCKASLRENIDLLLIKSNYIFFSTLYIQSFYNVIFCVYSVLFIQYHREILYYVCHLRVQPVSKKIHE